MGSMKLLILSLFGVVVGSICNASSVVNPVVGATTPITISSQTITGPLTFTSASPGFSDYLTADQVTNYERAVGHWVSNQFVLGTEQAGTGIARDIVLGSVSRQFVISSLATPGSFFSYINGTSNQGPMVAITSARSATGGDPSELNINPTFTGSATAGYTLIRANATETTTGSGAKRLLALQRGAVDKFVVDSSGTVTSQGTIVVAGTTSVFRLKGYTVAGLPAGTQGDMAFVTDSLAPAFGAALVGGGAVVSVAFYNGAAWVAF